MIIRTETAQDYNEVHRLLDQAFGNKDEESELVERIRNSEEFIPELSIVAEQQGGIAGHILLSKAHTLNSGEQHEVIALAPLAVKPAFQKQGIGSKLMKEGLKRALDLGYGVVLLIGHPSYYPRFGFKPARYYGYELTQFDVPDEVFMVCELLPGEAERCKGELVYPPTFFSGSE